MKVLITGCARSGTTLITHLVRYFYSTNVIIDDEQHPNDYETHNDKDHILVIKKPYLTADNIGYFSLTSILSKGWKVIWMLRDGKSVISSKNQFGKFHADHQRWVYSNTKLLENINNPNLVVVRYEQLCLNPQLIMDDLKSFLGVDYQKDFENFYTNVESDSRMNLGSVTNKPITTESINKYNSQRITQALKNKQFSKLLTLFGYERM